jgi:hypothetical protein
MKFLRKNGEPATKTNSGNVFAVKPNVLWNSLAYSLSVTSHVAPPRANTSQTGTLSVKRATIAPISARLMKPKW